MSIASNGSLRSRDVGRGGFGRLPLDSMRLVGLCVKGRKVSARCKKETSWRLLDNCSCPPSALSLSALVTPLQQAIIFLLSMHAAAWRESVVGPLDLSCSSC